MRKLDKTGEKYITNEGYVIEIIQYVSSIDCTIQFEDGRAIKNMNYYHIKSGK